MAVKGVRVSSPPPQAPLIRRRPRQSRAQASAQALQDAFVQVLLERGFEKTTIREVAALAGVGVGTFYEYFGNMRALAALCIHQRVKALEVSGLAVAQERRGQPLAQLLDAQLDVQVGQVMCEAPVWAALFQVERQVSTLSAFRKHYEAHVQVWDATLQAAAEAPCDAPGRAEAARMLHALTYGWVSQSLLASGALVDAQALRVQLGVAVHAVALALLRPGGSEPSPRFLPVQTFPQALLRPAVR